MIVTPTCERNLANLKVSLNSFRAVLIQGDIGCGKSFYAHALAEEYGAKETLIQVDVDDSFDSKDLLGKFSATDTPGAFEWIPGPLTSAVENGFWILMEDIDLASFDVFSVLLSLLEESNLFLPDKNKRIQAHPNFKIIATQQLRVVGDTLASRKTNSVPFMELWGTVVMESLPPDEMCTIATSLFPVPSSIVLHLARLVSPRTSTRLVTLRCLLKWCKRVNKRLPAMNSTEGFLSSSVRELMFREAFDCILAGYPDGNDLFCAMTLLTDAIGIQSTVGESLVKENKPNQDLTSEYYTVGRITMPICSTIMSKRESRIAFAATKHAMSLLERLAAAVEAGENILLTGETGVGKTFIVQYLADQIGQNLVVHNLNQQTDTSDFMGGWKPLDVGVSVREAYHRFVDLFSQTFNASRNIQFLDALQVAVRKCSWLAVVKQILKGYSSFKVKNTQQPFCEELVVEWDALEKVATELLDTLEKTKTTFTFQFEEGSLAKAWRMGSWILLDELNLASTEILERVSSVLGDVDNLFLNDKGNCKPIKRHKNFHVFANMNPPTDIGKKDLPPSLRSKFTEFFVSEPFDRNDINIVVNEYIGHLTADSKTEEITTFFLECVGKAKSTLCSLDGESKPPSFSLRTLTRALAYVRKATQYYGFALALFDGLMLGFATSLQRQFHGVVEELIVKNVFYGNQPPRPTLPRSPVGKGYVAYGHIWLPIGSEEPKEDESFILTPSVRGHLLNVARAVFADRPVLLEGPTSSGKSSMVKYLAELTGHKFVRINNHESTEIQEYVGHYVSDERGKLRFVDGILVDAVRNGYWVVLDELNLAPTDVLEALNRLLDDNRELFVADTQETVKPHPQFRIFATQNPAGAYGGRKLLSRAFRNRFLEITVDDIPTTELCTILCQRYSLNTSFSEKMVEIMASLQIRRQASQVFAGRHGFITPRDLFRWAERKSSTYQEMAEHGFLLLAERCRKQEERQIVKDVIESITKVEINEAEVYSPHHWPYVAQYFDLFQSGYIDQFNIVWTESMRRLFTVVGVCLYHKEPVLLVGETGSSKTTVCQIWASILEQPLSIVNCHQHTEAADFLGCLRPVPPNQRSRLLFEWRNGPLVECMLRGNMFLLDEISLSEDSVLERLNSVLEPKRTVTLAEKSTADVIVAHENFRIMATMNPGGDFGKKELSPALRNRFTEVYVRPTTDEEEVTLILSKRLVPRLETWACRMAALLCHIAQKTTSSGVIPHISIRDIIGWVSFMNAANEHCDDGVAFMHGLDAVILDGISVGTGQSDFGVKEFRETCLHMAKEASGVDESCLERPFWDLFNIMDEPKLPIEMEKKFFFGAPSTRRSLSKLARASIMRKAILLEGSPGVGKTSIVEALGCALGKRVVRINLSEQTDIMDLFGTYLPFPSSNENEGPQFAWSDGVLLQALKTGWWVILDELNLASQAVLEGLNALLDHRSSVFIPELGEEFRAAEDFRIFACQNPLLEGGGRKGLPRSFLNRFTKVRIDPFEVNDLLCIAKAVYPNFDCTILEKMVHFVGELHRDIMVYRTYGLRGSPWEFNLRDILRWAKLMELYNAQSQPAEYAEMLFMQRMRTDLDRDKVHTLIQRYFSEGKDDHAASATASAALVVAAIPDYGDNRVLKSMTSADFLIADNVVFFGNQYVAHRLQGAREVSSVIPLLLPSQATVVRSLLMCAEQKQFCLLVGPSGSGKAFSIHTAAALVGARVVTFSMNASCDTVDLLGGFDQVEGKQGQFEWRDSLILEAMLTGDWLVLDNVNYCNASVLDRLNPLVEPDGILSVNEQGLVDGQVRVVRPHPNFRLFATQDPKYGEISRAMRNRAVEIYVSPISVPSLESFVITGANSECRDVSLHVKLSQYHREFVRIGFHADTTLPLSSAFTDALSAGAPNTFTLARTASMLPTEGATIETLRAAILHRYIQNRCGHWAVNKSETLAALNAVLEATDPPLSLPQPTVAHLLDAFRFHCVHENSAMEALIRMRVARGGLALQTAALAGVDALDRRIAPRDLALFVVLEQCADTHSTATTISLITNATVAGDMAEALAETRRTFLRNVLPLLFPSNTVEALVRLITPQVELGLLWCRAARLIGPHSVAVKFLRTARVLVADSPLLNNSFQRVLTGLGALIETIMSPIQLQRMCRYITPLIQLLHVNFRIADDNFVPLVTHLALLRTVAHREGLHGADALVVSVDDFLTTLRRYLDLPYAIVMRRTAVQRRVVRPHITTPEERTALAAWTSAAEGTALLPHERLLLSLWHTAVFRSEFALLHSLQRVCQGVSVASLLSLQADVRRFISRFCTNLRVVPEVAVALWTEVLALPPREGAFESAVSALFPLVSTHFVLRHGLVSGRLALNGSWAGTAHEALALAASVTVTAIGVEKGGYHAAVLTALTDFCGILPISPVNPFFQWEQNTLTDLLTLLGEDVAQRPVLTVVKEMLQNQTTSECVAPVFEGLHMAVHSEDDGRGDSLRRVALACALRCRLLCPNSPIDPMFKWDVKRRIAQAELEGLTCQAEAFRWSETLALRDTAGPPVYLVQHLQNDEEARLRGAMCKCVPRPDSSGAKFAQLTATLHQLCATVLNDDRLAMVLRGGSTDACAARQTWAELLHQQMLDVLTNYGGYEDVTLAMAQPALFAALAAHTAIAASPTTPKATTMTRSNGNNNHSMERNTTSSVVYGTLFSMSDAARMMQFPFLKWTNLVLPPVRAPALQQRLSYFDSCLMLIQSTPARVLRRETVENLFTHYRDLYRTIEELEEHERRKDAMSVLYAEKAITIEGDDERHLRTLKELFPSYEEEFVLARDADPSLKFSSEDAENEVPEVSSETTSQPERAGRHARIMLSGPQGSRYIRRLLDTHYRFYLDLLTIEDKHTLNGTGTLRAFKERFDVLSSDVHRAGRYGGCPPDLQPPDEQLLLGGFAARAALLKREMTDTETSLEGKRAMGFNIFMDPAPSELGPFGVALCRFSGAIKGLLVSYPDTPSLQRGARIADSLAALPVLSTPLMKVMAGCEVLLRECYEWERNASRDTSILTHMTELSSYVLRWRRLELHCWSQVFTAKREEWELRAGLKWFHLYDLIDGGQHIQANGNINGNSRRNGAGNEEADYQEEEEEERDKLTSQCMEFFRFCMDFMWGAHYGDFHARLHLIEAFGLQLLADTTASSSSSSSSPLANAAMHVVDFFSQYASLVSSKLQQALTPLEEDMEAFTRIMRWEDATYYAVRATSEKSHLKMGRALAELEAILATPVLGIISAEEQRCEDDAAMGFTIPMDEESINAKKRGRNSANSSTTTLGNKHRKRQRSVPPASSSSSAAAAAAAASLTKYKVRKTEATVKTEMELEPEILAKPCGLLARGMEFLRSSADEIVARVHALQAPKVPQNQKLRALKILFTTLAESGVPHTHENRVQPWEILFAAKGALLAARQAHCHVSVQSRLTDAAAEYYRFARWLQRMRDAARHPHRDLSAAQATRGGGTAESLFALGMDEADLISSLLELRQSVVVLRDGVAACEVFVVRDANALLYSVTELCVQIQCLVHDAGWMQQERMIDDDAARAALVELGCGVEELWRLCLRCEAPRRARAPVADALLEHCLVLMRRIQGVCMRLQSTHTGSISAASGILVESLTKRITEVETACTHAGNHDVRAKRPRLEVNETQWDQMVLELANVLDAACADVLDLDLTLPDDVGGKNGDDAGRSNNNDDMVNGDHHDHQMSNSNDDDDDVDVVYTQYADTVRALTQRVTTVLPQVHSVLHNYVLKRQIPTATREKLTARLGLSLECIDSILSTSVEILFAQSHFGLVLSRLLCVLFKKGFCKSDDDDQDKDNDNGDGGDGAPQDGTGMDDGEGIKDVTDQIENEDQLMNMKDKEEQPEEEDGKKDEGDENEEDNAADVETDFKGQKERREESEDDDDDEDNHDDDESNQEMGSVDGEDNVQERKKMKRDKTDDGQDMRSEEDGGDGAEEVPEDDFADEDQLDEETGNFENREEAIREAEKERKGEDHDLIADNTEGQYDDESETDSHSRSDSGEGEDKEGEEDKTSNDNEEDDRDGSSKSTEEHETSSSGSEGRSDGDTTDDERDADKNRQEEVGGDSDDGDEDSQSDADAASEAADTNVRHGGRQDDHTGEEATERDKAQERPQEVSQQPDATGAEEEEQQPGTEQQQDDAGRNWRAQQQKDAAARRDTAQERQAASRNPYRAISEALQRHERRAQQLDLGRRVQIEKGDPRREEDQHEKNAVDDEDVDEFDFDEEGEREGMAATDERPPADAENNLPNPQQRQHPDEDASESDKSGDDENEEEAPDEKGRRRRRQQHEDTTLDDATSEKSDDKLKSRNRVRATARQSNKDDDPDTSSDDEQSIKDAENTDEEQNERATRGRRLWQEQAAAVQGLSHHLCEQLRLILAPTLADKLQGDYKTGKRLNMKRIIPYIASQFKKDRIWLRRTKPNKRSYQILVALDDSLSMQCNHAGAMSCRAVCLLAEALRQLEVGELGLACFGRETRIVHEMGEPFTGESGPRAFSEITFAQKSTSLRLLLETSLEYLDNARERMHGQTRSTTEQLQQMMFIISDGQITEDRAELRRLLVRAEENRQIVVFVLLDVKATAAGVATQTESATPPPLNADQLTGLSVAERMRRLKAEREARLHRVQSNSILDTQVVEFRGGKVVRRAYMEDFPFPYYLVVREIETLPGTIADAIRQWFEMMNLQN